MKSRRFYLVAGLNFVVLLAAIVWAFVYTRQARAPIPELTVLSENRVTFLAVGDIMLSRGVARAIEISGDPLTPFKRMKSIFLSTDFNFGNLEAPISPRNDVVGKDLVFHTRRRDIAGLVTFNFKILNLANNHTLDQGLTGLRNTKAILGENNLGYLGAGENLSEAWRPKMVEVRGLKIGFVGVSYSSYNDNGARRNDYVARIEDTTRLEASISELRSSGADFIVATMHAGTEYVRHPNGLQTAFAHTAIDLGADIVIGAHPHWVQTVERYKGKYIFYSLGNFIFDQEWSRDTKEGLVLKITLNRPQMDDGRPLFAFIEQIEMIPVVIENYSTPRPASDAESAEILSKIGESSRFMIPPSNFASGR